MLVVIWEEAKQQSPFSIYTESFAFLLKCVLLIGKGV